MGIELTFLPLPLRERDKPPKAAREKGAAVAALRATPLPALRATFSHKGRRKGTALH